MSTRPSLNIDETVPGELVEHDTADVCRRVHPVTGAHHHVGGPAEVMINGFEAWFINGRRHRIDGPAYVDDNGVLEWWADNQRHRIDGPATTSPYTEDEWWVRGVPVTDPADVAELDALHTAGDTRMLEVLLTVWREGGPPVAALRDAVIAAES